MRRQLSQGRDRSADAPLGRSLARLQWPEVYEPADHVRLGRGDTRYQRRSVDLATFATDTRQSNWLKIATQFAPLIKDGAGWAAVQG